MALVLNIIMMESGKSTKEHTKMGNWKDKENNFTRMGVSNMKENGKFQKEMATELNFGTMELINITKVTGKKEERMAKDHCIIQTNN